MVKMRWPRLWGRRQHRALQWARAQRGVPYVPYACGGPAFRSALSGDEIPAILSPGRSTVPRPGESLLEATERLSIGEDL